MLIGEISNTPMTTKALEDYVCSNSRFWRFCRTNWHDWIIMCCINFWIFPSFLFYWSTKWAVIGLESYAVKWDIFLLNHKFSLSLIWTFNFFTLDMLVIFKLSCRILRKLKLKVLLRRCLMLMENSNMIISNFCQNVE